MDPMKYTYNVPAEIPSDPILVELLPEFLSLWIRDLTSGWEGILERGENEELRRFGHTIKGSFLQFGFRELASVGIDVMSDAANDDWLEADARIRALASVVKAIMESLTLPPHSKESVK